MIDRADPETVRALLDAGRACARGSGTHQRPFSPVAGYAADAVVRRLGRDDPRRVHSHHHYRIAIRVDAVHARAHKLPEDVDGWLAEQEWALQALWDEGVLPEDMRLGIDLQGASHLVTGGRHRMSLWYVFRDATVARVST